MNINTAVLDDLWTLKRDLAAFRWILNDLIESPSICFSPAAADLLEFLVEAISKDADKAKQCIDYLEYLNKQKEGE